MKIKLCAVMIVLLLIGVGIAQSTTEQKQDAFLKEIIKNQVICFNEFSPYEYGFKTGRDFNFEYRLLDVLFKFTKNKKEYTQNQLTTMKEQFPFFFEELKGLSDSTNIKLERLISIQKYLNIILDKGCTTTLSTGKATKYNETFLTQNLDQGTKGFGSYLSILILRLFTLKCNIMTRNTIRYKYAFWGVPVLHEIPFLNEAGLGLGGTCIYLTKNESRTIDDGQGIPPHMLERLAMMICKNVSEVAELWRSVERTSSMDGKDLRFHYSMSFCDKEGGILVVEYTHNNIITVFGNSTDITGSFEGILWHTNHHIWLDSNLTGSIYKGENMKADSSYFRAERAKEILCNNYGNITIDTCKNLVRDHGGGSNKNGKDSYDICCHPDNNNSDITVFSWIIMPKNFKIYWTRRSPCKSRFIEYDFSSCFL